MKKIKGDNQYSGGKRNIYNDPKPRPDNSRDGIKRTGLLRNGIEPNDYGDRDMNENDDRRRRASRPETSLSNQTKMQRDIYGSSKMDSVKAEMQVRSRRTDREGKIGNRRGERKNGERTENS